VLLRFEQNDIRADTPTRLADSRIYPLTGQAFATVPFCRPINSPRSANYVVAVDGNFTLVYGTSASAPVVGAIITLMNDARLHLGKRPIGGSRSLIFPFISAHPSSCRVPQRTGVCALNFFGRIVISW
jgi:hypothetical protein